MIKVSGSGSEPLEKVLKRFKKKCEKEGLIKDIKRSSYYEKPSERRRRKERKMIKRAQKAEAAGPYGR
ncbi:MAG TPA: 30S ribosomal protein S21 [Planctomycetota bacterium]|nr:30S ribosomal protein S21 [Planctomycetota bacterium]